MSKRNNIAYIKPQDPSFLAKLKSEIGYKEGPSVETKRQKLEDDADSAEEDQRQEREDEKPQIVVLQRGDLTADEVAQEEARIAQEENAAPADLSKPVKFQKPKGRAKDTPQHPSSSKPSKSTPQSKQSNKAKLSFDVDDDEDNEDQ